MIAKRKINKQLNKATANANAEATDDDEDQIDNNKMQSKKVTGTKRTAKKAAALSSSSDKSDAPSTAARAGGVRRKAKEATKKAAKVKGSGSGCINVMLAHNYDPEKHDPTGWLMSEKLDGVRCYWNGNTMYTRTGKPFYAPPEWKAKLPKIALDGELWTDRDDF